MKAIVTGATSGIGKALAELLEEHGYEVTKLGSKDYDLSVSEERKKLSEKITLEKPTLFVNNAGFGLYGDAVNLSTDQQVKMVEVNCLALLELTLSAANVMKKTGGTILNISSVAAFTPFPGFAAYAASKAFVNSFSEAVSFELKSQGVKVLTACPGRIESNFSARAAGGKERNFESKKMSVRFAAETLYHQIQAGTPVVIFNWKYRLIYSMRKIIPKKWLFARLHSIMHQSR